MEFDPKLHIEKARIGHWLGVAFSAVYLLLFGGGLLAYLVLSILDGLGLLS